MKKAISILLVFIMTLSICMSLTACGGTKLTLDNYENYLTLDVSISYKQKSVSVGYWGMRDRTTHICGSVSSQGVSQNFNYNDVKIKVRIYGTYGLTTLASTTYDAKSYHEFETFVEISPNISGTTPEQIEGEKISGNGQAIVDVSYEYEIVSISGTITPA